MPGKKKKLFRDKNVKANKDAVVLPDPETIQKTDPQEEMKGPVSSTMKIVEEVFDHPSKKKK